MNPLSDVFTESVSGYSSSGGLFLFIIVIAFIVLALESGLSATLGLFGKGLVFIAKMYAFCAAVLFLILLWNYLLINAGFPKGGAVTGISMLLGLINALWLINIWEKHKSTDKE